MLALIRNLILAWTETAKKVGDAADAVKACVTEIQADADKGTAALQAFKVKVF